MEIKSYDAQIALDVEDDGPALDIKNVLVDAPSEKEAIEIIHQWYNETPISFQLADPTNNFYDEVIAYGDQPRVYTCGVLQ